MSRSRSATITISLILPALAVLGLLVFLEAFEPVRGNLLWRELFNMGHLPLFGLVSLLLLRITRFLPGLGHSVVRRYVAAFSAATLLAALSEIVQIGGPRDADIFDFLRDLTGIVSFLLIHLVLDHQSRESVTIAGKTKTRLILLTVAVALMLISSHTVIRLGAVWGERDRAFPMLFTFENWWEETFVTADNAHISYVTDETDSLATATNHLLQVDYRAATYTGLILQDFYPDWSGFNEIAVTVNSLSQEPELILFRVDDITGRKDRLDRFERVIELQPGLNRIIIPLDNIAHGPQGRLLDLHRVKRIVLFSASQPRREFSLQFDDFQLR